MGTDTSNARLSPHRLVDLVTSGQGTLFAIVNGYRSPEVLTLVHGFDCPVESLSPFEIAGGVGPRLVQPNEELLRKLLSKGWGQKWCIYLRSEAPIEELAEHFRALFSVSRAGGEMQLRLPYYEPGILRPLLSACTTGQRHAMFGPVASFMLELDGGDGIWMATPEKPQGEALA